MCTQADNAIDAPSENHRSDKNMHHHNVKGLEGIYLEQPEVDGYSSNDFNKAWKLIIKYVQSKFSEALAKSVKLGRDMASESYTPPMDPGYLATEQQKEIDKIMLRDYVKDLTTFADTNKS